MKKLILIFFISICFIQTNYSQELYGSVLYVVSNNKNKALEKVYASGANDAILSKMKQYIEAAEDLEIELVFNPKMSRSKLIKTLENDTKNGLYNTNKIASGGDKIVYTDLSEINTYIDNPTYNNVLIKQKGLKWALTNESKLIGNRICFKATTKQVVENSSGVQEVPITAWYTKEISLSLGPYIYNGAPGLILEVIRGNTIIKARSISFDKKNIHSSLKVPKKTVISQKEANSIAKKNYNSLIKN